MPMKYDPDTGIPSYVPDLGEELEEGVTPAPKVITSKALKDAHDAMLANYKSKADVFKGDKPLTQEMYEKLRDGPTVANSEHYSVGVPPTSYSADNADEMLDKIVASAKPAKLDKDFATDEEVDAIEKLANSRSVMHWPELLRLINRLRRAERG